MGVVDLLEVVGAGLAGGSVASFVGRLLHRPARPQAREPICTGYDAKGEPKHDCKALRSPSCSDGRCSFHCQKACDCDKTGKLLEELDRLRPKSVVLGSK